MNLLQIYCWVGYWKIFENRTIVQWSYGQEFGVLLFFDSQCSLVLSIWFSPLLCLSLFLHTRHALCSPRWSLTVFPCFVTTGLFTMHLLYYSFIVFLASAFFALIYNVLFQPLSPNNSWLTTPYCQPIVLLHQPYHFCCLLVYSLTLVSTVIFFFRLFFSPATLNSIQVLQPSRCALSTSALFFILFILLHSLIWSIHTTLTFSVSLKFGSNPLQPLLNSWTALLNITPWSALPVMAPARSHPLAVVQVSLCANLSHSYPHLLLILSSCEPSSVTVQLSHSNFSTWTTIPMNQAEKTRTVIDCICSNHTVTTCLRHVRLFRLPDLQ